MLVVSVLHRYLINSSRYFGSVSCFHNVFSFLPLLYIITYSSERAVSYDVSARREVNMMTYSYCFILNEALVFLAYGFAVQGRTIPAVLTAAAAGLLAVCTHSLKILKRNMLWILLVLIAEYCLLIFCGLGLRGPSYFSASASALISAVIWHKSSCRTVKKGIRLLDSMAVLFLLCTAAIPQSRAVIIQILLIESTLFMPFILSFISQRHLICSRRQIRTERNTQCILSKKYL